MSKEIGAFDSLKLKGAMLSSLTMVHDARVALELSLYDGEENTLTTYYIEFFQLVDMVTDLRGRPHPPHLTQHMAYSESNLLQQKLPKIRKRKLEGECLHFHLEFQNQSLDILAAAFDARIIERVVPEKLT